MLSHYFGFSEDPFGATPDPRFLYSSGTHREALASLHFAFYSNRGFTALIAPPGMGKTTLLFEFLDRIKDTARTAFLFNSQCEGPDILREILREVGLEPKTSLPEMLQQLNAELVKTAHDGRHFVVVVDEAQNLNEQALETLRLLTNFETARAKLMQIVLSGQPQLSEKLLRPGLVQLRQRISTFCRLEPFAPEETAAYISHRLKVAGYSGSALFTSEVLARIAQVSQGIPRNINTICFNALSLCCAQHQKKVDLTLLNEAVHDLQLDEEDEEMREPLAPKHPERSKASEPRYELWRLRVPAVALGLLIGAAATFWAVQSLKDQPVHAVLQPHAALKSQAAPALPVASATADPAVLRTTIPETKADAIEITVEPEQTLSDLSVRTVGAFDDTVLRNIRELNPDLANPDLIHPGQKILFPRQTTPPEQVAGSTDLTMRNTQ